jgi:hypothetical protein
MNGHKPECAYQLDQYTWECDCGFIEPSPSRGRDLLRNSETSEFIVNTNLIHNVLNFVGLLVGALLTYDWTQLGLTAEQAAFVAAWVLTGDKVIKLAINIVRDGFGGLFKTQPPVE